MVPIWNVMLHAIAFEGGRYVFGKENDRLIDRVRAGLERIIGPSSKSDCSELVENACRLAGVEPPMPDGSWYQFQHCHRQRTVVDIATGMGSYGRLLFRFDGDPMQAARPRSAHVALSLGDGTTFEARGSRFLVGVHPVSGRGWTHAAEIPGVDYSVFPRNMWMGRR